MTITEKIIAAHVGRESVRPGEFVYADVDFCLGNDITAPIAIQEFEKAGLENVFAADRIALIPDHFTPNKDIQSADQVAAMRRFARKHDIVHYYEVGRCGIEHAFLPEQGLVTPGQLIIGADSHTCTYGALGAFSTGVGSTDLAACMATGKAWLKVPPTIRFTFTGTLPRWIGGKDLILHTIGSIGVNGATYKAMEFDGPVIRALAMDGRLTMCNMAIEAGAKNGIITADSLTLDYVKAAGAEPLALHESDDGCEYLEEHEFDVSALAPQVAAPHLPENARPVQELADVSIDQVVIGSCTNGRISDLREAASIIKGRQVAPHVRAIIIPATPQVHLQAAREGLVAIFVEAGAAFSTPTCGPCLGGHMGVLAAGERALATTNRNFVGRMGDLKSEVYLCGPAVAAASAVTGRITHPEEVAES